MVAKALTPPAPEPQSTGPDSLDQRLVTRVRSRALARALRAFAGACKAGGLPNVKRVLAIVAPLAPSTFVVAVEHGGFRMISIGRKLAEALPDDRLLPSLDQADPGSGTQLGAYLAAVRSRAPTYENLLLRFGEGPSLRFERLLLPAADDGRTVTHLVGVALMERGAPISA